MDGYCRVIDSVFSALDKALEYIDLNGGDWEEYTVN